MDINTVRGIITILLMVTFIGLVIWAYSSKRKKTFDEAANLPFADEETDKKTLNETETK
ncbi:CcoQ/FixQ family Cbb3-type cytochrome c oxidase assembly chaperone [Hahella ganghwensis]|uniref:CcoQ/FixQ family Cbb3-type cytochrome c oxidase assembly chaperone n=1 Tax=Hahella ganghwensis TaxID=286420 RepID=UPI000365688D|nr:CcoQ/FixQ family Cbb3-type cytochrome c oxidase assembly chaperone [Hahella ganghwensis]